MSRWFRHYAGMARDAKLVAAALKSQQPVERVVWVWAAILESAAEINDDGRFELDAAEAAYFLRADADDVARILGALEDGGRVSEGHVVRWGDRQFQSDRSAERQQRYRDRKKASRDDEDTSREAACERNADTQVTSPSRHGDAPDTETDTELEEPSLRSGSARGARSNESRASKKGTRLSTDWQPSEADVEYAVSRGVPRDKVPVLAEEFRNYWCARPGKDSVKLDWSATWRNRVLQVCEHRGWQPYGQPKAQSPPVQPQAWITEDDPRLPDLAARWEREHGRKPRVAGSRNQRGIGAYFPSEWLAQH